MFALAVFVALCVVVAASRFGPAEYDYLAGAAAVCGLAALGVMVLGPSRIALTVFIGFMAFTHQFRSFAVLPAGGVEWHPRELLLFVLCAHLFAQVVLAKADLRPDITHYFFFLYVVFFVHIATRGFLRHPNLQDVIAECRYPLFLASYFVFAACLHSARDVRYFMKLILWLSLGVALAGIGYFLYCLVTGNVVSVQNALGEYVQRLIGPFLLQSVRPNGHMYFEVSVVVLAAYWLCPATSWGRRVLMLPLFAIFLFAIAITMMRTAYVSLFVSMAVLFVLFLPKELQIIAAFLTLIAIAVGLAAMAVGLHEVVTQAIPGLEISIKGRVVEIQGAVRLFLRSPIMGAGMGSSFTGLGYVAKTTQVSYTQISYQTVHNVWVYYLFKGGLAGLVLVGLGLGGIAGRGYLIAERIPSLADKFLMRGLLAAFIGQLIASLAMPRLTYPKGAVFLAMVAAAFVAMHREYFAGPAPKTGLEHPPESAPMPEGR